MATLRRTVSLTMIVLFLSACGGGGSAPSMTDIAKQYYETYFVVTADKTQVNKLVDLTCQEHKAAVEQAIKDTPAEATNVKYDVSGVKYEVVSQNSNEGVVKSSGVMKITMDGNTQEIPANDDSISLRNENGWKVCEKP
jgi:hypothetical protein